MDLRQDHSNADQRIQQWIAQSARYFTHSVPSYPGLCHQEEALLHKISLVCVDRDQEMTCLLEMQPMYRSVLDEYTLVVLNLAAATKQIDTRMQTRIPRRMWSNLIVPVFRLLHAYCRQYPRSWEFFEFYFVETYYWLLCTSELKDSM